MLNRFELKNNSPSPEVRQDPVARIQNRTVGPDSFTKVQNWTVCQDPVARIQNQKSATPFR